MTLASGEEQVWNNMDGQAKQEPEATPLKSREQSDYNTKEA